jgi:hypothetical protein
MIYDVAGRRVYLKTNVDSQELKVVDLVSSQQVLLVKVVLQDGKSITKKGDSLGFIIKVPFCFTEWDFFYKDEIFSFT